MLTGDNIRSVLHTLVRILKLDILQFSLFSTNQALGLN